MFSSFMRQVDDITHDECSTVVPSEVNRGYPCRVDQILVNVESIYQC